MQKNRSFKITTSARQKIALGIFGLIAFFVFLEAGMRLGGFALSFMQDYRNSQSIKQKGAYRILCLGESTTRGQYPHFLEEILNRRNIGVRFSVIDEGKSATNTSVILSRLESYLDEYHPDMVVAMMGINDEGKHIPFEKPTSSKKMLFIRSFRIYKLARLLWLHLLTKAGETGFYKPDEDTRSLGKVRSGSSGTGPKENPARPVFNEDSFKKTIALDPGNDNAYVGLGRLYRAQSKFPEAENAFKKAIELNPENDNAYLGLGLLFQIQREFQQAEGYLRKAIEINPKNDNAYVGLGRLCRMQGELSQAEGLLQKAIELNPESDNAYVGLGVLYRVRGKFSQAGAFLRKAIELNPKNDFAFYESGWFYLDQGKFSQAESAFNKVIAINPENNNAYVGLGRLYRIQGKFSQAEEFLRKAIELNPKNDFAFYELGWFYRIQNKPSQAEDSFRKAIELNPKNDKAYLELGGLYRVQGELSRVEGSFKKAVEIDPKNDKTYLDLGGFYREQGEFSKAEDLFKKSIELNPENERALGAIASLYEETGRPESAKEYAEKANRLRTEYDAAITVNNYRKLKEILDRKRVKLVCVQYPVRNVDPLKRIFGKDEGIIFVDNENVFKEGLKQSGHKAYFSDMFGGDFGHCTLKGNTLLAQNIADEILKEVFNK